MKEIRRIVSFYDELKSDLVPCALLTVVHIDGSSYRRIGARMLISTDGRWEGGISGGCLEGDAQRKAQFAIQKGEVTIVRYDTREEDDKQIGIGLGCNGLIDVLLCPIEHNSNYNPIESLRDILNTREDAFLFTYLPDHPLAGRCINEIPVGLEKHISKQEIYSTKAKKVSTETGDILIEKVRPQIRLIIFGDNYDIYPLIQQAAVLDWKIELIGKRTKFKNIALDSIDRILDWTETAGLQVDNFTAIALMAHDYNRDFAMLHQILKTNVSYIGILGPKKRFQKMKDDAVEKYPNDNLSDHRIHSPIGLDIGAETPEEIATSILGEMVGHFRGKQLNSLRDKKGPIHERA